MDATTLGDRELDVMTTLWRTGSGTVDEVHPPEPGGQGLPAA
jgi:predicted transcriptional regulator